MPVTKFSAVVKMSRLRADYDAVDRHQLKRLAVVTQPSPSGSAKAGVTGLTRGQVLRSALIESAAVTATGLLLGGLAAGTTLAAVWTTTEAVTPP